MQPGLLFYIAGTMYIHARQAGVTLTLTPNLLPASKCRTGR